MEEKKKLKSNTEDEYNKALASDDPTKITKEFFENKPRIRRFTETLSEEAYLPEGVELLSKITQDYFKKIDLEFLMSLILRLEDDKDRILFENTMF